MANNEEAQRLQRALNYDREALSAIYDDYHLPLYRYIYRRVGDVDEARDLTADVFQRFLDAVQRGIGPQEHLRAWLYRAAHNAVVDCYRRRAHRRHLPLPDEDFIDDGDDPDRAAESHLLADDVRGALGALTPDQQQVIALKFLAGFSNQETADTLDKPVGAVKALQHRALAALRRALQLPEET